MSLWYLFLVVLIILLLWFLFLQVYYKINLNWRKRKYEPEKDISRRDPKPADFKSVGGNKEAISRADNVSDSTKGFSNGTKQSEGRELLQATTSEFPVTNSRESETNSGSIEQPKHRRFFRRKKQQDLKNESLEELKL